MIWEKYLWNMDSKQALLRPQKTFCIEEYEAHLESWSICSEEQNRVFSFGVAKMVLLEQATL